MNHPSARSGARLQIFFPQFRPRLVETPGAVTCGLILSFWEH